MNFLKYFMTRILQITTTMLEQKGIPQNYIEKIQPIAYVMSAYQSEVANGETCTPPSACATSPTSTIGIIDENGSEMLSTFKLPLKSNKMTSDRIIGFVNPMPTGDITIREQVDKEVQAANSVTANGYIALPDLRIGEIGDDK